MINKKHLLRSFVSLTCVAALVFAQLPVSAAPSSKELKKKTSSLENELSNLNSELASLGNELEKAAAEIKKHAEEVEKTKLDLASAKLNEELQYEAMSERIKFMYEGGSVSLLHILFTAESMGDFLNKAEYVTSISDYDRDMLKDFKNVRINIEEKQKKLEDQQAELTTLQKTLKEKETALKLTEQVKVKDERIEKLSMAIAEMRVAGLDDERIEHMMGDTRNGVEVSAMEELRIMIIRIMKHITFMTCMHYSWNMP